MPESWMVAEVLRVGEALPLSILGACSSVPTPLRLRLWRLGAMHACCPSGGTR